LRVANVGNRTGHRHGRLVLQLPGIAIENTTETQQLIITRQGTAGMRQFL